MRSKCGGQRLGCVSSADTTENEPSALTPYLLPIPYYPRPLLWCAKRACVLCGKSQRGARCRQSKCGGRTRRQPKKNSALNSHFAKGRWERLEDREVREAVSCLDVRRWRVSRRPQGAFVSGGARRRRLSWSRPQAARLWSVGGMRRRAGLALRANTKRRNAPFTKARWRGTRKRPSRPSRHETVSSRSRREGASRKKE